MPPHIAECVLRIQAGELMPANGHMQAANSLLTTGDDDDDYDDDDDDYDDDDDECKIAHLGVA